MSARKEKDSRKRRILIVDDEPDFLWLVRDWLEPKYEVAGLYDGRDLLVELDSFEPDLVVLDVNLPGRNGFSLCREILAQPRFAMTPVMFLTAARSDADYVRNLDAGGSGYITKPTSRRELLAKVEDLLSLAA